MNDNTQLKEAIASLMKDRSKRDAFAEMITEYVQPGHIATDFVSMLLNTRRLQPGDSLVKKLRKGIEVRTLVPGSIHLASEITVSDRVNYKLDGSDVKVQLNQWELENGEIGTIDEIKREMLAKYRDHYMNKVFTALSTVWTAVNTPNNFVNVGGPVTAAALEDAIDYVNQNAGGVKAVIGSRVAMTPITKFAAFWSDASGTKTGVYEPALQEVMQRGMIGRYYGAPLITIEQSYDYMDDHNELIPTDKILVLGENIGEFITFGDVKYKQYEDMRPTPPYLFLEYWQQYAMLIWNASGLYVIGGLS